MKDSTIGVLVFGGVAAGVVALLALRSSASASGDADPMVGKTVMLPAQLATIAGGGSLGAVGVLVSRVTRVDGEIVSGVVLSVDGSTVSAGIPVSFSKNAVFSP